MANISVWLDNEDQLICQRIEGAFTVPEFNRMLALTAECVARLDNPEDVRILVDARAMDGSDLATRKLGARTVDEKGVKRMALWGATALERTVQRFMMILVGEKRMRTFAAEKDARAWLMADRCPPDRMASDARAMTRSSSPGAGAHLPDAAR
jgi:hypothetical protein